MKNEELRINNLKFIQYFLNKSTQITQIIKIYTDKIFFKICVIWCAMVLIERFYFEKIFKI